LGWLVVRAKDEASRERDKVEAAEKLAAKNAEDALQARNKARDDADLAKQREIKAKDQAELVATHLKEVERSQQRTLYLLNREKYLGQIARVESIWDREPARGLQILNDESICPKDQRDFAWGFYRKLCTTELATLKGHSDAVTSVAINPDGTLAATAAGNEIKLWDVATRKELATLSDHTQAVTELLFSPDGKLLASRCNNQGIRPGELFLWDVTQSEKVAPVKLQGHRIAVTAMVFSHDSKLLITGSGEPNVLNPIPMEAKIWNVETGKEKKNFPIPEKGQGFFSMAISPDDKLVAVGTGGTAGAGIIHIVEIESGKNLQSLKGHSGWVTSLAFADNNTVISGSRESDNPTVRIWKLDSSKEPQILNMETEKDGVVAVRMLGDGKTFAAWTRIEMKLWDVASGAAKGLALSAPLNTPQAVAFSPDGNTVAVRALTKGRTTEVSLWDISSATSRGSFRYPETNVECMIFAPDSQTILTGWSDATLRVLNARTAQESTSIAAHQPRDDQRTVLAVSPDGKYLASGGADGLVRLWNSAGGNSVEFNGHSASITGLAFSPDGRLLFSSDRTQPGGIVKIWDVLKQEDTKKSNNDNFAEIFALAVSPKDNGDLWAWGNTHGEVKIVSLSGKRDKEVLRSGPLTVNSLAFSPDGKYLAIGLKDTAIHIRDVAAATDKWRLKGHKHSVNAVAFSPDNKFLASVAGEENTQPGVQPPPGEVKLWDLSTGNEIPMHGQLELRARCVAFSPDGKTIATGSSDGLIKLWDVSTGEEETILRGRPTAGERLPPPVTSVVFAPDGKTLYSADTAGVIKAWQVLAK
jgi:WD40 repeat protein